MKPRVGLVLSGAVGILLAALIYLLGRRLGGALGVLVPVREAEAVIFSILCAVSLLEMPFMVFGMRYTRTAIMNRALVYLLNTFYVAFAAVYAAIQVLIFGESNYSVLLVGMSLARWVSGLWTF